MYKFSDEMFNAINSEKKAHDTALGNYNFIYFFQYNKITIKKILNIILIVFLLYCFCFFIKLFIDNKRNNDTTSFISQFITSSDDKTPEEPKKEEIDFNSLLAQNPQTKGWITVPGTNINYPVVQSEDNDYYLTHSFDSSKNSAGWIFADYRVAFNNEDKNIVIYGHNRSDGSMFATLKNVVEKDWYSNQDNYKILFQTPAEKKYYQVFSVYTIKAETYFSTCTFNSDSKYQDFLNKIKKRSEHDFNIDVNSSDQILTLSTCANNNAYRIVLHAKKIVE